MKKRFITVAFFFAAGLWLWVSNEGAGITYNSPLSPADLEEGQWQLPKKQAAVAPPPPPVPAPAPPPPPPPVPAKVVRPARPAPPARPQQAAKRPLSPFKKKPAQKQAVYAEQVEESWSAVASHLFNERFGMGQEDYQEYLRLRNAFQTEKGLTLEERSAAGLTPEEERQIVDSIRQRHHEDLRRQIGDDRFEDYRLTLARFNQALRLQQRAQGGQGTSQTTIEF